MIRSPILLGTIVAIIAISITLAGITSVTGVSFNPKEYSITIPTNGSGSFGTGSVAVAAFFSGSASKGAGAFSGDLMVQGGGLTDVMGIFYLTDGNPTLPVLPCGLADAVAASGIVISGSFKGDRVLISGCVGTSSLDMIVISNCSTPYHCIDEYAATGNGNVALSKSSIVAGTVLGARTSGSGTAGLGTLSTAEADALAKDGSLLGGGAFVGSTSDVPVGQNNWTTNKASIQAGCTATTQGVTGLLGSFPNQPVTTSATLNSCPPASIGPQSVTVTFAIGSATNPMYTGHGSGTMAAIQNTR